MYNPHFGYNTDAKFAKNLAPRTQTKHVGYHLDKILTLNTVFNVKINITI